MFEWTGSRSATISQRRKHAVNALKLLKHTVVCVSDSGLLQVFALPDLDDQRGSYFPDEGIPLRRRSVYTTESETSFSRASTPTASTPWPPLGGENMRFPLETDEEGHPLPVDRGQLLACVPLPFAESSRPLTATFSEVLEHRKSYAYHSLRRPLSAPPEIVIQVADSRAVSQYALRGLPEHDREDWLDLGDTPRLFPYDWPPVLLTRAEVDRVTSTTLGSTGVRGAIMGPMIGGIPPVYCVQLFTRRPWSDVDEKEQERASWERAALAADSDSNTGSMSVDDVGSTRASTPMSLAGSVGSYLPEAGPGPQEQAQEVSTMHTQARALHAQYAAHLLPIRPTPDTGLPSAETLASSADLRRLERILGPNIRFNPPNHRRSGRDPREARDPRDPRESLAPARSESFVGANGGSHSRSVPSAGTRRQTSFAVPEPHAPHTHPPVPHPTPIPHRTAPEFIPPQVERDAGASSPTAPSSSDAMSAPTLALASTSNTATAVSASNSASPGQAGLLSSSVPPASSSVPPVLPSSLPSTSASSVFFGAPGASPSPGSGGNLAGNLAGSLPGAGGSSAAMIPPLGLPRRHHRPASLSASASASASASMSTSTTTAASASATPAPASAASVSSYTSSSFGPPSRSDIMAELCLAEAHGIICLGTARGNLWIGNYLAS